MLPVTSTTASSPVVECPGGQNEELVGGLVEEGGEAGHRVVPEMEIVDEAAEQFGQDHDVVLQGVKARDGGLGVWASDATTSGFAVTGCLAAAVSSLRRSGNRAR